jgi:RNA polymerase sigma-70 factor, ECF subfamily
MSKLSSDQNTEEVQFEQLLVKSLKEGDDLAWDELYQRYFQKLVRFCSNYVNSLDEAEDLSQDIFIKLKNKASLFDEGKRLRPWLYSIARNHCLDYIRSQKIRKPKGELWSKCYFATTTRIEIPDFRSGPSTEQIKTDNSNELNEAVDSLSEEHRSVFLLKYSENFSREEIAQTLNVPLATVKSRLYYSLKKLREKLKAT